MKSIGEEKVVFYGNTLPHFSDFLNSFMLLLNVVRLLIQLYDNDVFFDVFFFCLSCD